jgi:hypothetical protein
VARLRRGEGRAADGRLAAAIHRRHADRRPFSDERPATAVLEELGRAAERHGVHLRVVRPDQVTAFASAVLSAGAVEHADARFREDVRAWTARPRTDGDGIAPHAVVAGGPAYHRAAGLRDRLPAVRGPGARYRRRHRLRAVRHRRRRAPRLAGVCRSSAIGGMATFMAVPA